MYFVPSWTSLLSLSARHAKHTFSHPNLMVIAIVRAGGMPTRAQQRYGSWEKP